MRIAFLTAGLTKVYRGGPLLLYSYARALKKFYNVNVRVYSLEKPNADLTELHSILDKDMLKNIELVKMPWEEKTENRLMRSLRYLSKILRDTAKVGPKHTLPLLVLRREAKYEPTIGHYMRLLLSNNLASYDVVHMGALKGLYTIASSKLHGKLPYKTMVHTFFPIPPITLPRNLMLWAGYRNVLSRIDALTTSTMYETNFLKKNGLPHAHFVGEAVDVESIEREARSIHVDESMFTLVYVGARSFDKGYYHMLLSAGMLAKKIGYNRIKVVVIGHAEESSLAPSYLLRKASKAYEGLKKYGSIEDYIFVSEREKLRHFKRASIVLLPSKIETIPLVALEGWALKKPSILADIPTVRSVIGREGNGAALVKYGDIEGMAAMLEYFYKNPRFAEALGLRGYSLLKREFTLQRVSTRLFNIYKGISMPSKSSKRQSAEN